MSFEKRKILIKTFVESQFGYSPFSLEARDGFTQLKV